MSKIEKIQKNCLKLLDEFISVCDKHKLKWFADGGTLLGAMRKGKMIAWDDDVDVVMPREDYDKLFYKFNQFSIYISILFDMKK